MKHRSRWQQPGFAAGPLRFLGAVLCGTAVILVQLLGRASGGRLGAGDEGRPRGGPPQGADAAAGPGPGGRGGAQELARFRRAHRRPVVAPERLRRGCRPAADPRLQHQAPDHGRGARRRSAPTSSSRPASWSAARSRTACWTAISRSSAAATRISRGDSTTATRTRSSASGRPRSKARGITQVTGDLYLVNGLFEAAEGPPRLAARPAHQLVRGAGRSALVQRQLRPGAGLAGGAGGRCRRASRRCRSSTTSRSATAPRPPATRNEEPAATSAGCGDSDTLVVSGTIGLRTGPVESWVAVHESDGLLRRRAARRRWRRRASRSTAASFPRTARRTAPGSW